MAREFYVVYEFADDRGAYKAAMKSQLPDEQPLDWTAIMALTELISNRHGKAAVVTFIKELEGIVQV